MILGPIFNQQKDKIRMWQITINLYNKNHKQVPITGLDMNIPEGYTCEYYTTNGLLDMKMTDSAPTIISTGKNLGKKNATNVLTQTYNDCISKYKLKIKSGYSENKPKLGDVKVNKFPFPMALKPWKDFKDKLIYPLYVQPKLDGLRMIVMLDSDGKVVLKTRRLHDIPKFDNLKKQLQQLYDASQDKELILDGELYAHKLDLQIISGIVRSETDEENKKDLLQFWIFDCFSTKNSDPFEIRIEKLKQFVNPSIATPLVLINDTKLAKDENESNIYYNEIVSEGFEGIIYKSCGKPYEYSFDKEKRSSWYLKRKQVFDDEFEIYSFTEGKGKDKGCIVFILKTKDGIEFNSVPNGTYEYRKELYQQCLDDFSKFKGKLAKVQYEDMSSENVPLRNRMIMIRDLSFD